MAAIWVARLRTSGGGDSVDRSNRRGRINIIIVFYGVRNIIIRTIVTRTMHVV